MKDNVTLHEFYASENSLLKNIKSSDATVSKAEVWHKTVLKIATSSSLVKWLQWGIITHWEAKHIAEYHRREESDHFDYLL